MSNADERRSEKLTGFLQNLESYVTELVKTSHGASSEDIMSIFKQNFNRSMSANVEFHEHLTKANTQAGDALTADFHKLHAEIYRLMMIK